MENSSNFSQKVAGMIGLWILSLLPTALILILGSAHAQSINFTNVSQSSLFSDYMMKAGFYTMVYNLFTVVTILIAEWIYKKRIHPIQYTLILLALTLFNLLLLSMGEYLIFSAAFVIAGIMTIGLVTFYSTGFFSNQSFPIKTGTYLFTLYLFMYVMITLPDSALLVGSLSFFVLLAIVMYYTRKIDFYGIQKELDAEISLTIQSVKKDKFDSL
jgi:inner membrane protein involved in colicin E2 resistance